MDISYQICLILYQFSMIIKKATPSDRFAFISQIHNSIRVYLQSRPPELLSGFRKA